MEFKTEETKREGLEDCDEEVLTFDSISLLVKTSFHGNFLDKKGTDKTGLFVWPAAKAMCEFIENNKEFVCEKKCIELGSGTGLLGLFVSRFCERIILTDRDEDSLDLIARNIEANSLANATVQSLDWFSLPTFHADIVIAADVIYPMSSDEQIGALFSTAKNLLPVNGGFLLSYIPRDGRKTTRRMLELSRMYFSSVVILNNSREWGSYIFYFQQIMSEDSFLSNPDVIYHFPDLMNEEELSEDEFVFPVDVID